MSEHPRAKIPWRLAPVDAGRARNLASDLGISPVVARLLVARGVNEPDEAKRFLSPSMSRDWRPPAELPGLPEVAEAVTHAIEQGRRIVVFGDFDADGVTAAAILHRALATLGARAEVFLPHRFREGYGLTREALPRLLAAKPELVVTVDCGITAAETVEALREAQVMVAVTDHHEPGEHLPQGVPVANPKLGAYPEPELSGAGVALKLAQLLGEMRGVDDLHMELAWLAAIGTIGDIVPLRGENRALVAEGLASMRSRPAVGIAALAERAGVDIGEVRSESVAFGLVPRINAAGRMSDPITAFELLTTDDSDRATALAGELDELNRVRQQAELDLFEKACELAEHQADEGMHAIVVMGEGWHEGVRGIVASRLVRRFGVPSVVLTVEDGKASGSGRSVPGFDLHAALSGVADLLERFGGHAMAAGLALSADRVEEFRLRLCESAAAAERVDVAVEIDSEISLSDVSLELHAEIALLEPFGEGNPRPLFGARGVFMRSRRLVGKSEDHLLFEAFDGASSRSAVAFRRPDAEELAGHEEAVDLAFEVERDSWRGRAKARLLVRGLFVHAEVAGAPAATLVEDLFEAAPAILAGGEYAGIGDAESFHTKLAGVTFEGRQEVCAKLLPGMPLRLARQSDNPHDPNACALFEPDGKQVGFFNRRLAAVLAPLIDDGLHLDVTVAEVTGGEDEKAFGVNVLVERRDGADESEDAAVSEARREELAALSDAERDAALAEHLVGTALLRDAQTEALAHLQEGRNCLAVMATGRGKSLIFHLHAARLAVAQKKASVFVYPLRALVSDQSFHLEERLASIGIGCETLTGESSPTRRDEVFEAIRAGRTDIVLTTPEFLERNRDRFAESGRVGFLVVDEAHHIGRARASYRPAYARLGEVLEALGSPTVLAVTATAADEVARSISETLGVREFVLDPSVRTNLRIEDARKAEDKIAYIASIASRGEKVIVYVNSRDKSVRVSSQLRGMVPSLRHAVAFYNGGLTRAMRHAVERAFRAGDLKVVVATSAFGEGVDIPDVGHVVHFHLPFNEIEFNQMSGRAGRDGRESFVHLLYGPRDARLNELILETVAPDRNDLAHLYVVLRERQKNAHDSFEVTNAELAEDVAKRIPKTRLTDKGVSAGLGVFRELGLVDGEGTGAYRRLRVMPPPDEKLDLVCSVRYSEGVEEQATFRDFKEWALEGDAQELLARFNQPILPTRATLAD